MADRVCNRKNLDHEKQLRTLLLISGFRSDPRNRIGRSFVLRLGYVVDELKDRPKLCGSGQTESEAGAPVYLHAMFPASLKFPTIVFSFTNQGNYDGSIMDTMFQMVFTMS